MGLVLMSEIWCSMTSERNMRGIAIFYTRFLTSSIGDGTQEISLLNPAQSPQHSIYRFESSEEGVVRRTVIFSRTLLAYRKSLRIS